MTMVDDHQTRFVRALLSLEGLSIGDALGEQFFFRVSRRAIMIAGRELPPPPWDYTDDTRTALSIIAVLKEYATIDQDCTGYFEYPFEKLSTLAFAILFFIVLRNSFLKLQVNVSKALVCLSDAL
jgi:hypothetical protein